MKDRREYYKKYRIKNSEILRKKQKEKREANKELVSERKKIYYEKNREKILSKNKETYEKNKDKYRITKKIYIQKRITSDPIFKLKFYTRSLIRNAFKRKFTEKSAKTIEILGCSFEEFKLYIEKKFDDNMNWDNYGEYWELDHIKPISISNTEKELLELNHYTNFQPLYWRDNLKKSDNY
jgi:sugar-specific transcriptional regulator TrmB